MTKPAGRESLFATLKNLSVTLLAIGQTRLELLGNELEAQKLHVLRLLLLALAMLFCAALAVLLLVVLAALVWWDQRVGVVAGFAVLFVAAAAFLYRALMRAVNAPEPAFAATLAELREDVRRLKKESSHASPLD